MLRLHEDDGTPICNFDPATTVLAHIRASNVAGWGQKPPDLCGVWACSNCHDVLDGRVRANISKLTLALDTIRAWCATLAEVSKEL